MTRFYKHSDRGYFHRKRHPHGGTMEHRAFLIVCAIKRPQKAGASWNGRTLTGKAFRSANSGWRGPMFVRSIKAGRWDGPWRREIDND